MTVSEKKRLVGYKTIFDSGQGTGICHIYEEVHLNRFFQGVDNYFDEIGGLGIMEQTYITVVKRIVPLHVLVENQFDIRP